MNPVCSRLARAAGLLFAAGVLWLALPAGPASATPVSPGPGSAYTSTTPQATHTALTHGLVQKPVGPHGPHGPSGMRSGQDVSVNLRGLTKKPSTSVTVILAMTLLSLLPAILLTCTSFTKVLVVLGLTRNALGLQQIPPNQVLAGLALFLSLFIMSPVLGAMNDTGLQPYLDGDKTASVAFGDGIEPLRHFMVKHTGDDELRLLTDVSGRTLPTEPKEVAMTTLIPSFVLTELKQAFIIGFIIFIPFLVIDIVVSGALMALGMMMMPPVMVSLPFKLLLFVLVDGWGLVITSVVSSYH